MSSTGAGSRKKYEEYIRASNEFLQYGHAMEKNRAEMRAKNNTLSTSRAHFFLPLQAEFQRNPTGSLSSRYSAPSVVDTVLVTPDIQNHSAIACYQKAGFVPCLTKEEAHELWLIAKKGSISCPLINSINLKIRYR